MNVFVTGGTGFVGREVVGQLLAAGHRVTCLARSGSDRKLDRHENLRFHLGDITDPDSLGNGLNGCEAVIHLVGIIREFPRRGITFTRLHTEATDNIIAATRKAGIRRFIHMSANGAREQAETAYHRTKWAAEQALRGSDLDWTIFRPSLIYGPGDQFVNMLAGLIRKLPLVPVIGNGRYRMSPVAVEDVAAGFVRALQQPQSIGQVYHCGGPQILSYDEILDLVGRALGRGRVVKLHQPLSLMKPVVAMMDRVPAFPITRGQLAMLVEGNEVDPSEWAKAFEIEPKNFFATISSYLKD
ncbi:NAD-dependent dehydratase [Geothermobacter hydrogeniphilus]|uniref:NAD-dependent dehydratase n=1 Tax=Geothermobacter hydrogeniphilus TaxID=1969733 RepID=A0A2K2HEY8_9BACT|nr:complex I NDUFA9 subunit family protein [Geothermobacter hydrogeniphilus]PNU21791.1 NAD-dependent dehydratase [Geothermobacter hydrogeniphilus]